MTTGTIIRLLRTADGVSQGELAQRLGVSRTYLSQVENDRKQPGLRFLRSISGAYKIPVALLLIESDSASTEFNDEARKLLGHLLTVRIRGNPDGARRIA